MWVWQKSGVTVLELKISKIIFCIKSYVEKYFQLHKWSFLSLFPKILGFFRFWKCWVVKDQISEFENRNVSNEYFASENLGRFPVKRYFKLHKLRFFFPQSSTYLNFFLYTKVGFREIKDHSFGTKKCQKYISQSNFRYMPAYCKKVFWLA